MEWLFDQIIFPFLNSFGSPAKIAEDKNEQEEKQKTCHLEQSDSEEEKDCQACYRNRAVRNYRSRPTNWIREITHKKCDKTRKRWRSSKYRFGPRLQNMDLLRPQQVSALRAEWWWLSVEEGDSLQILSVPWLLRHFAAIQARDLVTLQEQIQELHSLLLRLRWRTAEEYQNFSSQSDRTDEELQIRISEMIDLIPGLIDLAGQLKKNKKKISRPNTRHYVPSSQLAVNEVLFNFSTSQCFVKVLLRPQGLIVKVQGIIPCPTCDDSFFLLSLRVGLSVWPSEWLFRHFEVNHSCHEDQKLSLSLDLPRDPTPFPHSLSLSTGPIIWFVSSNQLCTSLCFEVPWMENDTSPRLKQQVDLMNLLRDQFQLRVSMTTLSLPPQFALTFILRQHLFVPLRCISQKTKVENSSHSSSPSFPLLLHNHEVVDLNYPADRRVLEQQDLFMATLSHRILFDSPDQSGGQKNLFSSETPDPEDKISVKTLRRFIDNISYLPTPSVYSPLLMMAPDRRVYKYDGCNVTSVTPSFLENSLSLMNDSSLSLVQQYHSEADEDALVAQEKLQSTLATPHDSDKSSSVRNAVIRPFIEDCFNLSGTSSNEILI